MLTHTLRQVVSGLAGILGVGEGLAPLAADTATDAIQHTITQVFRILSDAALKGPEGADARRQQLETVIGNRLA